MSQNTNGTPNLFPFLRYKDAPGAIQWLVDAFGFREMMVVPNSDGTVAHAELSFGPSVIMLSTARDDELRMKSPLDLGAVNQGTYVYLEDVDAHCERAKEAGAEIVRDPEDTDYGSREYTARDPEGHLWSFGTYRPQVATQPASPPPQMALYQMAIGHYLPRALNVATKLGIADLLKDGPKHYTELATATETHAPSLNRVMRFLASAGVFDEQEDGKFALTPVSEALRAGVPGSARAAVLLFSGIGIQDAWKDLEYCVRTGEPAYRSRGLTDPFADLAQHPEQAAVFDEAMADFTRMTAIAVAAAYDFSQFGTIVDVGGGNGALLIGILNATPAPRGIVFDLAAPADRAREQIKESSLENRCEAVGGDFFKEVPGGGDAYILKHVIHDWDDERATAILKNCRRVMGPESKLLIVEGVYPPRIDQSDISRGAAANDVNMLVSTGGRQRSEAEFRSLYEAAGFKLTKIVPTQARVSVIEGTPV